MAAVYREVVRRCRAGGLPAPARNTLARRIEALDPAAVAAAREGADDRGTSLCVVGLVATLEAPSALSVGLCLAHTVCDKRPWLEWLGVEATWPMSGKPHEIHLDNATEFRSEALRRGCDQHGITLAYRPKGMPHFGGIIERLTGTMIQMVHELPGTTTCRDVTATLDLMVRAECRPSTELSLRWPATEPRGCRKQPARSDGRVSRA
ncbi:transposase family protein [Planotetraspora sp. A-T 1434]|uniref:transposase family protein n=1 Tax=Planotetraspora sp. A-T 1434 TaxID=2979219 RepID=UPI0021BE97BE|nr:transposase family protein [Planotetraspora sp. A-T 1434]MCT9933712.1 transposase family protein [Planotetraspora sp. A-T 1434]